MVCIFSFLQILCFRGAIKIIFPCCVLYSNILIYIGLGGFREVCGTKIILDNEQVSRASMSGGANYDLLALMLCSTCWEYQLCSVSSAN